MSQEPFAHVKDAVVVGYGRDVGDYTLDALYMSRAERELLRSAVQGLRAPRGMAAVRKNLLAVLDLHEEHS